MLSVHTAIRVSALALAGAAAAWPAPSWAQSVTRSGDDRITVEAQGLPIGRVLRELLAVAPVEALMVDPKVENHPVSLRLVGATPGDAINQLLADSGLPYTLWGGARGPWRIFVGDKDAALRVTATSPMRDGAAPPAPAQEAAQVLQQEQAELRVKEEEKVAEAMAQRQAEAQPIVVMSDPDVPGGYTMIGESVTYHDPTFVPYKNLPEVRARRLATDVALIP